MDQISTLRASIDELSATATRLQAIKDQEASRAYTDAIRDELTNVQTHLQAAFPALKSIRREVFQLQPGESPNPG